jgi:hypothetical protein
MFQLMLAWVIFTRFALGRCNYTVPTAVIFFTQPGRIDEVDGIAADIGVHIHAIGVTDRVGLHEAAERGGVEAGFVIVHADFR